MAQGDKLKAEPTVSKKDLDKISLMNKDQIEAFILTHFSIDIDKRGKISDIRADATKMIEDSLGIAVKEPAKTKVVVPKASAIKFVRNPIDGNAYPEIPWGESNPDWLACDASGILT
jgi:hypothetical protein